MTDEILMRGEATCDDLAIARNPNGTYSLRVSAGGTIYEMVLEEFPHVQLHVVAGYTDPEQVPVSVMVGDREVLGFQTIPAAMKTMEGTLTISGPLAMGDGAMPRMLPATTQCAEAQEGELK